MLGGAKNRHWLTPAVLVSQFTVEQINWINFDCGFVTGSGIIDNILSMVAFSQLSDS